MRLNVWRVRLWTALQLYRLSCRVAPSGITFATDGTKKQEAASLAGTK